MLKCTVADVQQHLSTFSDLHWFIFVGQNRKEQESYSSNFSLLRNALFNENKYVEGMEKESYLDKADGSVDDLRAHIFLYKMSSSKRNGIDWTNSAAVGFSSVEPVALIVSLLSISFQFFFKIMFHPTIVDIH